MIFILLIGISCGSFLAGFHFCKYGVFQGWHKDAWDELKTVDNPKIIKLHPVSDVVGLVDNIKVLPKEFKPENGSQQSQQAEPPCSR